MQEFLYKMQKYGYFLHFRPSIVDTFAIPLNFYPITGFTFQKPCAILNKNHALTTPGRPPMKKTLTERILKIYGIALAVCSVIAGICLMVACYGIYAAGGQQPYTPETVAAAFAPISVPVYLWVAMTIISIALRIAFPKAYKEPPLRNQPDMTLKRMHKRRDLSAGSAELKSAVVKLQKLRKTLSILCAVICGICLVFFLIYALNSNNFHKSEINQSMINAMCILAPCLVISGGFGLVATYRIQASMVKESELLKECPKRTEALPEKVLPHYIPLICKCAIIVLAVGLLVYGFISGGTADVLTKAKNICTECVGLG